MQKPALLPLLFSIIIGTSISAIAQPAANPDNIPQLRIAFLTDIHVSPGTASEPNLENIVSEINEDNYNFAVVTGDITNTGLDTELIYYVQDDNKAYTGVNKAHADIIDMIFGEKTDSGRELKKVVMRNDVEGSMIPFKKVNFDEMVLRGFKWLEARRPKSREDLFE